MRSKTELVKTAGILKAFSAKIKQAQDGMPGMSNGMGETLTPEAVQDIAMEIQQVAEVASELASEIAEGVPAEEATPGIGEEAPAETPQIETAQEDGEEDKEKKMLKEQVANLSKDLDQIKRASLIEKLATKYASLFPKSMKEAKMNEILTSKAPMTEIQTRVQEASEIIENKTMIKIAQAGDSIFDISNDSDSEEVNIAAKM